jgi:hypothetical protein
MMEYWNDGKEEKKKTGIKKKMGFSPLFHDSNVP